MYPISYAQNGEDVVLQRALHDIEGGFYIDIGAFDPHLDSVTKAFYELGWSGINVEPVPEFHARFVSERVRDQNLNIAVGKHAGLFNMSAFEGTGLSTFSDAFAQKHETCGFKKREILVPMATGNDLFEKLGEQTVHFLKIDAEGSEFDIIDSIDFKKYRPWIVLGEATEPNSRVRCDAEWARVLEKNGYEFVYFDGLNTFFLAEEHSDRRSELAQPPNVFDNFVTYANHKKNEEISELRRINEDHQSIIASQSNSIDEIKSELLSVKSINAVLEQKISALAEEISNSTKHLEGAEKTAASHRTEIANLRAYIDECCP